MRWLSRRCVRPRRTLRLQARRCFPICLRARALSLGRRVRASSSARQGNAHTATRVGSLQACAANLEVRQYTDAEAYAAAYVCRGARGARSCSRDPPPSTPDLLPPPPPPPPTFSRSSKRRDRCLSRAACCLVWGSLGVRARGESTLARAHTIGRTRACRQRPPQQRAARRRAARQGGGV